MFVEDQSSHTESNIVACVPAVKKCVWKKVIEIFNHKDKIEYN